MHVCLRDSKRERKKTSQHKRTKHNNFCYINVSSILYIVSRNCIQLWEENHKRTGAKSFKEKQFWTCYLVTSSAMTWPRVCSLYNKILYHWWERLFFKRSQPLNLHAVIGKENKEDYWQGIYNQETRVEALHFLFVLRKTKALGLQFWSKRMIPIYKGIFLWLIA